MAATVLTLLYLFGIPLVLVLLAVKVISELFV